MTEIGFRKESRRLSFLLGGEDESDLSDNRAPTSAERREGVAWLPGDGKDDLDAVTPCQRQQSAHGGVEVVEEVSHRTRSYATSRATLLGLPVGLASAPNSLLLSCRAR
jgi:hypothetical protein